MMRAVGNKAANRVWEATLMQVCDSLLVLFETLDVIGFTEFGLSGVGISQLVLFIETAIDSGGEAASGCFNGRERVVHSEEVLV